VAPTIAIGNVPAIPPQKPASPTEDPNHPPAVAPPIVATPSGVLILPNNLSLKDNFLRSFSKIFLISIGGSSTVAG